MEYFGYHRDMPPAAAAQILGGRLVYAESRNGQWVGVIEAEQVQEARRLQDIVILSEAQQNNYTVIKWHE